MHYQFVITIFLFLQFQGYRKSNYCYQRSCQTLGITLPADPNSLRSNGPKKRVGEGLRIMTGFN